MAHIPSGEAGSGKSGDRRMATSAAVAEGLGGEAVASGNQELTFDATVVEFDDA